MNVEFSAFHLLEMFKLACGSSKSTPFSMKFKSYWRETAKDFKTCIFLGRPLGCQNKLHQNSVVDRTTNVWGPWQNPLCCLLVLVEDGGKDVQ